MLNRTEITDKIIAAMRNGTPPWKRPFATVPHQNLFSTRPYNGINQLLLNLNVDAAPYWGSYRQWQSVNCQVRKGQKSSQIVYYKIMEKTDENGKKETWPIMRQYAIFHIGQIDDQDNRFTNLHNQTIDTDYSSASAILQSSGAVIRIGGNQAFYNPTDNYMRIPSDNQFTGDTERLVTIFHELGHWGHQNIIGRQLTCDHHSPEYAFGELVAEITACFLCQSCSVPNDLDNSASYIDHWCNAMRKDTNYIFNASKLASTISDHLLKKAGLLVDTNDTSDHADDDAVVAGELVAV